MSRILVTGVGGAAGIATVQHFRKNSNYVYGVNCLDNSPGFQFANNWSVVPYACNHNYIPELLEICKNNKIEYVFPTVDEELIVCSQNKQLFNQYGINMIVSETSAIENCLDKYKLYKKLSEANVLVAKTWRLNNDIDFSELSFPVIVKPATGRGGRGVSLISSVEELYNILREQSNDDYIVQEYAEGIEYSVDTLSDLDLKAIVAVPRKRLEIKGGICWRGCTDFNQKIIDESKRAVETVGIFGPACLQLIYTPNNEIKIFEINPRIGGTISLTINSGVDVLNLTLKLLKKELIIDDELKFTKKYISRYFADIFFDGN